MALFGKHKATHHPFQQYSIPNSKVHGANMGPIWGRQDPGGPQIGPMNFVIWDASYMWLYALCPNSYIDSMMAQNSPHVIIMRHD